MRFFHLGALALAFSCCQFGFLHAQDAKREVTFDRDVIYGHKAGMALTLDVVHPAKPNGAAILFMVSGGWVSVWAPPESFVRTESKDANPFEQIVDKGYTLVFVRHGSSPYFKVPDAVADVRRAVRFVKLESKRFGIDPNRIGVLGMSAGGHLSLMLSTTGDEGNKDSKDPIEKEGDRVAAAVAWCPPTHLEKFLPLKGQFPAIDLDKEKLGSVSPLNFVTEDDAPSLMIHGDKDELVPVGESEAIKAAFEDKKVATELLVIPGAGHGIVGDDLKRATDATIAWFDKHLAAK